MITFDFRRFGELEGRTFLDVGAGGGRHAIEAARLGAHVVCIEISESAAREIARGAEAAEEMLGLKPGAISGRIQVVLADARALPLADESFDVIIASEVFEHIFEDRALAAELARVARAGATLAVSVPRTYPELVCWALSLAYHDAEGGHIRIYRRSQLERVLKSAGLNPFAHHHSHSLHTPYWWLKCLVGVDNGDSRWVLAYHKVLVAQMMGEAPSLERIEALLDPWLGKSLVVYANRV